MSTYESTLKNVRNLINDAVPRINGESESDGISASEIKAFRQLAVEFFNFLDFCEVIDYNHQCLDEDELDVCCRMMEK